jgi:Winged helix-turn helix
MTLEERIAELEAENAVLREQVRDVPLLRAQIGLLVAHLDATTRQVRFLDHRRSALKVKPRRRWVGEPMLLDAFVTWCETEARALWRRYRARDLKQQGWKQKDIAQALGVSESAVSQWLSRGRAYGVAALKSHPSSGSPPKLTNEQCEPLHAMLAGGALAKEMMTAFLNSLFRRFSASAPSLACFSAPVKSKLQRR